MKLSIVIPCYNEPETVGPLIDSAFTAPLLDWEREVIVVDDGSAEATKEALREAKMRHPELVLLSRKNGGKGAALKDGFKVASGDYLAIMDADLEYDPADLALALRPISAGKARVVFGSRHLRENNVRGRFFYYWGGRVVNFCFNLAFGTKVSDLTDCIKLFPRELVSELVSQPANDFVFDAVELSSILCRETIAEVPVSYRARNAAHGKKLRARDGFKIVEHILELRLGRSMRAFRFLITGGSAALLNILLLYLFTSLFGIWYLASEVAAFVIAVSYNFFLQKSWAFRHTGPGKRQFAPFFAINIVNLGANTLLLYCFVEYLGIWYIGAQLITSLILAFESYFIYRAIFRRP